MRGQAGGGKGEGARRRGHHDGRSVLGTGSLVPCKSPPLRGPQVPHM